VKNGRRGRRLSGHARSETRKRESRREREAAALRDPSAAGHWLDGFLGIALAAAEHEAFTAVMQRFPAKLLLFVDGD